MHTAIHQPRRIAAAQNRFLRRIRQALRAKIPNIVVGFQGGQFELPEVFANNTIWFAHQSLTDAPIPRNWNAFGAGLPALRRSNDITVEVNIALHGVNRMVAGLFALHDETGNTVLLHRGRIGGGQEGVGLTSFMEWYPGKKLTFSDPSHDDEEESAIFVADLQSDEFLSQLESFVDAVRTFKSFHDRDNPRQVSDADLQKKAATAPAKPKSSTTVSVTFARNRYVAELAKRRAHGKCELCGQPAPFTNASDEPYLECHHIVWLAHGGADHPENTIALCPNCHRKMHVVNDPKDIKTLQRRARAVLPGQDH